MIGALVTLIVGLLLIGLAAYIAREFFPGTIARIVNIVCAILAVLLVVYVILQFAGGAGASVSMAVAPLLA